MAIENFYYGSDILVLYTSITEDISVSANSCSVTPENQIHTFTSATQGEEATSFRVKEFNGQLQGQCVKDFNAQDNTQKLKVLSAIAQGQPAYQDAPEEGSFLTECWAQQGGPAPLNADWASSIGSALVDAANKLGDLNERARKTLIKGQNPRTAGPLIFKCSSFAVETMKRLYGLKKTLAYTYTLESKIGIASPITTSAEGERYFQVSYKKKTSESSATVNACTKALIVVNDDTNLKVEVNNILTEAELAALDAEFATLTNLPGQSSAWLNAVDNFTNQMEAFSAGTGPLPNGFLHEESVPGGGIFKIKITPTTNVAGAVFYVGAAFSFGTNANDSFALKFEGFNIQFSPNQLFYERGLMQQLRARYREQFNNYQSALQTYIENIKNELPPENPSPAPSDLLPKPDTIPVPPEGQAPSRESIPESSLPSTDVTGATGNEGGVQITNSGSSSRIIDSTDTSALISD